MANEHFISAARKHFNDANILHGDARHDNCAYLSGYVVECALKGMIETSGAFNPRSFGHDVSSLSTRATLLAAVLSQSRVHIQVPASQDYYDLLANWKPEERYLPEHAIPPATSSSRLAAANEAIQTIIIPLILNGAKL